jgi:predicted enzyme related to lactoylglutathione lyase
MNQVDHIELSTDDPTAAVAFYGKVFGWKIDGSPMPGGGVYNMFRTANGGGGITGKMMPEQPTAWLPYVSVNSIAHTLGAVHDNGGATVQPHTPIGDMGAIAVFRDPTGGHIGLWEPSEATRKQMAAAEAAKKAAAAPKKAAPKKAAPKKAAPKKAAPKKAAKKAAPKKAAKKKKR